MKLFKIIINIYLILPIFICDFDIIRNLRIKFLIIINFKSSKFKLKGSLI